MKKQAACCFTGHRKLPADKIERITKRLDAEIDNLIRQGVTDFISGGALGFDQIAASLIIAKKDMGRTVRLIFALPCENQDENWSADQKRLYRNLLSEADEVIYVSQDYSRRLHETAKSISGRAFGLLYLRPVTPSQRHIADRKYGSEKGLANYQRSKVRERI